MESPTQLLELLQTAGARLLEADPENLPRLQLLLAERGELIARFNALRLDTEPASLDAQAVEACAQQGRLFEARLAGYRSGLRDQLRALYRDGFHLRAFAVTAVNQPQEFDYRG